MKLESGTGSTSGTADLGITAQKPCWSVAHRFEDAGHKKAALINRAATGWNFSDA